MHVGEQNAVNIRHPLSRVLPGFIAQWLDMPRDPLSGDSYMSLHPVTQSWRFTAFCGCTEQGGRSEAIFRSPEDKAVTCSHPTTAVVMQTG